MKSGLKSIPENIGDLSKYGKLIEISFDFNELERIPDSISKITSLKRLTLSNNKLMNLPYNLGQLVLLEHLNVAYNQLVGLPESTRRLIHLKELFIQSNEINVLPSHGDPSGPGKIPSGSGPTALTVLNSKNEELESERILLDLKMKIKKSDSPREIMYWFTRIKEEYLRGVINGVTVIWLDDIAGQYFNKLFFV